MHERSRQDQVYVEMKCDNALLREPWRIEICSITIVLSQYTGISLPFQTVFNGGWSSLSLYNESGLMSTMHRISQRQCLVPFFFSNMIIQEKVAPL